MLNALRNRASGFTAKIILILLILSFAVWGIEDMLVQRASQTEIAEVGGVSITRIDLEREMQGDINDLRERLGANFKPEIITMLNLPGQVLQRMISQELIQQELESLGLEVGDAMVAELIRSNKAFADASGRFNKDAYLNVLKQNNFSEKEYVFRVKQDMASRLVSQAVVGYSEVPDIAVQVMMAAGSEARQVKLYQVNTSSISVPEPTDAEIETYFETISSRYATPEYRSVSYVEIDESALGALPEPTDEELQQVYDERKQEFTTPEYRSFEQLLYTGRDAAEQASALWKQGKTVAEVAGEVPPLNVGRTSIKQAARTALPEEVQGAAFALKQGEVSAPIQSSFGFHVMQLTEVQPEATKPFAEVKTNLITEMKPARIGDALTRKVYELEDMLAGGEKFAAAAEAMGLKAKSVQEFNQEGKTPGGAAASIPALANFVKLAFATDEQSESTASLGRPGVYYVLHVDKVVPETLPPIASVKAELVKGWKAGREQALKQELANDVAARLTDATQQSSMVQAGEVKTYADGKIKRQDSTIAGRAVTAALVEDAFSVQPGDTTAAHQLADGSYVVGLVESISMPPIIAADALKDNKQAGATRQDIRGNMQQELMAQFMESLAEKYGVEINHNALASLSAEG